MKVSPLEAIALSVVSIAVAGCQTHAEEQAHHEHNQIVVTSPLAHDVVLTQQYVCQIHSRRNIEVCALEDGYLQEIAVNEGQAVKEGDLMFKILPTLYQARLDAKSAEVRTAEVELEQSRSLFKDRVVSQVDVTLHEAKLANAQAEANLAQAELKFTDITARFDGIVDRLHEQLGSLIDKGDTLTTLSDNSVMWVYFNVPEARYLEYMAAHRHEKEREQVKLVLANGSTFDHIGQIAAIEAQFNNETGNIPFRADFPNPDRLLRHGQTGNVLIHQTLPGAMVIPQRATFEILDQLYVYIIDEEGVVHQRPIQVQHEQEDIFVVEGLEINEKFVLEGVRQVRDGEKVEYEFQEPEEALANLKYHAE